MCFGRKCMWRLDVIPIEYYVVKLLYTQYFSTQILRSHGLNVKNARSVSAALYNAVRDYALLRHIGYDHNEAFERTVAGVQLPKYTMKYVEGRLKWLVDNAEKLAERLRHRAPETGWRVITDERYEDEVMVFAYMYFPVVTKLVLRLPDIYTELVFCSDRECYPTPEGLWPDNRVAVMARQAGRHDIYYKFIEKYGAVSITDYILNLDFNEFAVKIKPKRKRTHVTFYVKVNEPLEHARRVADLQAEARRAYKELEEKLVKKLGEEEVEIG